MSRVLKDEMSINDVDEKEWEEMTDEEREKDLKDEMSINDVDEKEWEEMTDEEECKTAEKNGGDTEHKSNDKGKENEKSVEEKPETKKTKMTQVLPIVDEQNNLTF